jgi:hypothetical protein
LLVPDALPDFAAGLERSPPENREQLARRAGLVPLWDRARGLVAAGVTSPAEVVRVLGLPVGENSGLP